ncbi:hypothetical protein PG994_008202 [Apiospora phragmitis]|uniref:Uncharacterized protein n=1 Tax=Apiospora phragmitis TaxID=2905665 RepID=A0ABR1UUS0_9PEZI
MDDYNISDISAYVTKTFSNSEISTDRRSVTLADSITIKSQGVFLWAVLITNLILDHYENGENWTSITTRLSEVPAELSDLYEELLSDIPPTEEAYVTYQFFVWAVLSTQKLRIREWHHIFPFLQENLPKSFDTMANSVWHIENDEQLERKIPRISRGLVEVKHEPEGQNFHGNGVTVDMDSTKGVAGSLQYDFGETRSVQIIHGSVTQFFLRVRGFKALLAACNKYYIARNRLSPSALDLSLEQPLPLTLAGGHYSIMVTCLAYLNISELDDYVDARKMAIRKEGKRPEINSCPSGAQPLEPHPPA